VRTLFDAVNAADLASLDDVLARNFRSYAVDGMRTRTGMKVLGDGAVFDPEEVGRHSSLTCDDGPIRR
jgi:hypothetical protein